MIDLRKAAVIGCGHVGASIAFSLMQRAIFSELVLIDMNRDRAEGEAMDLRHGLPYTAAMDIYAGDYADLSDCALVIVTAGANQKPGESRLDLIGKNTAILRDVIGRLQGTAFAGILLIVSNPVDVLTCEAQRISGYPASRVIGSGTVLDTARLKQLLGSRLGVDSRSVHAVIIGEHGDSELAVWSGANVSGIALDAFCALRGHPDSARLKREVYEDVRAVLPVSTVLGGEYGLSGLALSIPSIVGRDGVQAVLELPLSGGEREALLASAAQLREVMQALHAR